MMKGSCLCGKVKFEIDSELSRPDACHCNNCRKQTGHFLASVDVPKASLKISGDQNIKWFQSSEKVRRGFCSTCGSTLFWDPVFQDWTAVAMGAFDSPTNTELGKHIFVSQRGDYYYLSDGLPQNER